MRKQEIIKIRRKQRTSVLLLVGLIMAFCNFTSGQRFAEEAYDIEVNGKMLPLGFAGGLNAPQFSHVDLNNDGRIDLVIFDKLGAAFTPLINQGGGDYLYAPEYKNYFPKVTDWALFRDYNGDGLEDIFASSSSTQGPFGIEIYTAHRSMDGSLSYNRYTWKRQPYDIVYFESQSGTLTHLYVTTSDVPAIDDIDGDGAMDILTFENNGGRVHYFRNVALDRGFSKDTLIFEMEDECWGKFYESDISDEVFLSPDPDICASGLVGGGKNGIRHPHAGSTLLTFDEDGDGDKEVLLGDLTSDNVLLARNGGDKDKAWITSQDAKFPSYDISVDMETFLASFHVDVDDDGVRDILISPNEGFSIEDDHNVLFYRGSVSGSNMRFSFVRDNVIVGDMVDHGTGSRPFFVDYNADGLLDIVVGNDNIYSDPSERDARLFLYENVGTLAVPAFQLVDRDYLDMNRFSGDVGTKTESFTPCFGDLDGDGDLDFVMGEETGSLFYAENMAGAGNPMSFGPVQAGFMGIDIGSNSVPFVSDINDDGLGDLLVGTRQGTLDRNGTPCGSMYYFRNQGSAGNPVFEGDFNDPVNDPCFGRNLFFGRQGSKVRSAPYVLEFNGHSRLYLGTSDGIKVMDDITDKEGDVFTLSDTMMGAIFEDERLSVALANIDDDPFIEMLVGTLRGGLYLFQTDHKVDGSVSNANLALTELYIFPNPAQTQLNISGVSNGLAQFQLLDMNGRTVVRTMIANGVVRLPALHEGLYLVRVMQDGRSYSEKLLIQY